MKKTILVVDDELEVAQSLESILIDEGYEVITAGNGLFAMELVKNKVPDLIISDVMMPLCNGHELIQKIKNDERLMNVPVVLMSAVHHEKNAAASSYLKKPFNLDTLLSTVEKHIGKGDAS